MTSERIKKLQERLPKQTVLAISQQVNLLPYLDESELHAFWLMIRCAYLDGKMEAFAECRVHFEKITNERHGHDAKDIGMGQKIVDCGAK